MRELSKVVVTGGAGFIGSRLVGALLKRGVDVVVLDNFTSGSSENLAQYEADKRLKVVRGDIRSMREDLKGVGDFDAVFHLAAVASVAKSVSDPIGVHDVNVNGSLEVLSYCLEKGVKRVIFASSAATYGPIKAKVASEDLACSPASPYGASKLAVENYLSSYCQTYGLETVALRFFNVYGAGQRLNDYSGVITLFASSLLRHQAPTIYGDGEQTRDFVNVEDVIRANILAGTTKGAAGEVINVASGKTVSLLQLLEVLKGLTGASDVRPVFRPPRPGDMRFGAASISKAVRILGYVPKVPIQEGLEDVVGFLKRTMGQPRSEAPPFGAD